MSMHTQKEDDCMSSQEWDKFGDKGIQLKPEWFLNAR